MSRITKSLTEQDWVIIQTRFETGDVMRDIADDFGISLGTVQNRAKKHGWERNKIVPQLTDIRDNIKSISQNISHDQLLLVNDQLKKEIDDIAQISSAINNLQKGALNLHGMILKSTIAKTQSGELTLSEASRIISTQGLTVDKIASMSGISKDKSSTNIQINNDSDNEVKIKLIE